VAAGRQQIELGVLGADVVAGRVGAGVFHLGSIL
jgi:hypothetical protein